MSREWVLVSGGSGFLAAHCIVSLLNAGYRVRTTVRSLAQQADVHAMLRVGGISDSAQVTCVAADLKSDTGWASAVEDCDFVLHVASPFPLAAPKHEDEVIIPAREGALRVLRAARDARVRRVVLTSSFAAVGYGHRGTTRPYSEKDWTELDSPDLSAYVKSKTLAERAAWNFIAREGGALQLSVINPVVIFGPALSAKLSSSILLLRRLMVGAIPFCPRLAFGVVDVRDVADLHVRAMIHPAAAGARFLAVAGEAMSVLDIALLLRSRMGRAARRAPTKSVPDWLVRFLALFNDTLAQAVPELGRVKSMTSDQARTLLSWAPRSNEDAVIAAAESLVALGSVPAP